MVVLLVGLLFIPLEQRLGETERRLMAAEEALKVLEPLQKIFGDLNPDIQSGTEFPYAAVQATGEPNSTVPGRDSVLAWCSAVEDGGEEWLKLDFGKSIEADAVRIHAATGPGAVVRVLAVDGTGTERKLWAGPAQEGTSGLEQEIRFPSSLKIRRIKLFLDTGAVTGWNEIDAVALVGTDGVPHWAVGAEASSVWSKPEGDSE